MAASGRLVAGAAVLLGVAVLLWPMSQGAALRDKAAQRQLAQRWRPDFRAIPLLALAHSTAARGQLQALPGQLDDVWRELERLQDQNPGFFWLELSILEFQAGRLERAKRALLTAQSKDKRVADMARGPAYAAYRQALGMRP